MADDASLADAIFHAFGEEIAKLSDMYEDGQVDECIEQTHALLRHPAIPRYYNIQVLAILAAMIGGDEGAEYLFEAALLWRCVRRWHPVGEDEDVDESLQQLRELLDDVKTRLREEIEEMANEQEGVNGDEAVPGDDGAETEPKEEKEMLAVDSAALDKTQTKLENLDITEKPQVNMPPTDDSSIESAVEVEPDAQGQYQQQNLPSGCETLRTVQEWREHRKQ